MGRGPVTENGGDDTTTTYGNDGTIYRPNTTRRSHSSEESAMAPTAGQPPASITHIIFDMDGLLLTTEYIYSNIYDEYLGRYNLKFTKEAKKKMMGTRIPVAWSILRKEFDLDCTFVDYLPEFAKLKHKHFRETGLMPGVMRLVTHLKQCGVGLAIGTNSDKESFAIKTARWQDLISMFDVIVCGDDPEIKEGKPSPDIFLVARKKLGNPPLEQCLVFEDSPLGVQAAYNAGMKVVWVPDLNFTDIDADTADLAACVITSLEQFQPTTFGLQPYAA
jgi:HAD superfamily hydrolase (TIGR01509 family)